MTNDNQDALRCAEAIDSTHWPEREVAAHLRRLVSENEVKDALLRQAVEALDDLSTYESRPSSIWRHFYPSSTGDYVNLREVKEKVNPAIAAIRQHLEGQA